MERDIYGRVVLDDKEYWTLVEMMNKFKDEYHSKKKLEKKDKMS